MAAEVVVSKYADDVEDVVVVDVDTIDKFEWDEKLKRYRIYQKTDKVRRQKVDLCNGNFFYIPNDPLGRADPTAYCSLKPPSMRWYITSNSCVIRVRC